MSSSMLEQAIIDAEALKEAAVKTAEHTLLEKYSTEIKDAVSSLLEQEEDEFGLEGEDEFGLGEEEPEEPEEREDVVDQLDMAATGGEKLCPCPEDGDEVTLDLDQLIATAEEEEPEDEMGGLPDTEEELFEIDDDYLLAEAAKEDLSPAQEAEMDVDKDGDIDEDDLAAKRKAAKKEDKPKSEGVEKIAPGIFEDSGEEEKRHYRSNRDEDERHLSALKKDVKYDDDAPADDASEEEKEHYRRHREADKKHITNLEWF